MRSMKPAAFALSFILAAGPALTCLPAGTSAADPPPGADWVITEDTFLMDRSFSLEWNLTVRSGAQLVMDNVSLNFTYKNGIIKIITVEKGALMVMRGCRLNDPDNSSQLCSFRVFGELKVEDSRLCNIYDEYYFGGLALVQGGFGTIYDSAVDSGLWGTGTIFCSFAVLELDNITCSGYYGVIGRDSRLLIANSTFTTSETSIDADDCTVDIDRCMFNDNYQSCLDLADCSAQVTGTDFGERRQGTIAAGAPLATRAHELTVQDCRFENNEVGAVLGYSYGGGYRTGIVSYGSTDCFLFNDSFSGLYFGVEVSNIHSARLTSSQFIGYYSSQYAVLCDRFNSGECLIDNNRFEDCDGVDVHSGSAQIEGNVFRMVDSPYYYDYSGIYTDNGRVDAFNNIIEMNEEHSYCTGIYLEPTSNGALHNIRGNRISGGRTGIRLDGAASVQANIISNSTTGIYTQSDSYLTFNTVYGCQAGIVGEGYNPLRADNNTLSKCTYGIRYLGYRALDLTCNDISAVDYGIEVAPSTNTISKMVIDRNIISASKTGISVHGAVADPKDHSIAENSISDCEVGIELISTNIQTRANEFSDISCWGIYALDTVTGLEEGISSFCSSAPNACRAVKLWTGFFQVFYNPNPLGEEEIWRMAYYYHLKVRDALGRTLVDSNSGMSSMPFKEYLLRAGGERVDFNPYVVEAWQDGLGAVRNDVFLNLTSTFRLYLKKGPDLAVTAINMSSPSPVEGELVFFLGTVLNRHNFNPDKIIVNISQLEMVLDDGPLAFELVKGWTSNTEWALAANWMATPGWHNVTLTAMVGQAEWDVFPDNNRLTRTFYVTTMPYGRLVADAGSCFAWTPFELAIEAASEDPLAGYRFDFGDGQSSGWLPSPNATHTYAAPGDYTVRGWVATMRGAMYECAEPLKLRVLLHFAAADIISSPDPAPTLRPVLFTASLDQRAGDILKSTWDFGDGSYSYGKEMLVAEHSYAAPGSYDVTLSLELAGGGALALNRTIWVLNTPPVAAGRTLPEKGDATTVFTFQSESSDADGHVLAVRWDFGDGTSAASPRVTHSYATHGLYKVGLTVQDDAGDWSAPHEFLLAVDDIPPAVTFKSDKGSIKVGSTVRFDASATTDLDDPMSALGYSWDFGDGRTGRGPVVEHTYSRAGSYSVTLTVEDGAGGQTSKNMVMVVSEAPLTGIDWRWPAAAVSASALAATAILFLAWRAAHRPDAPPRVIKRRLRRGG